MSNDLTPPSSNEFDETPLVGDPVVDAVIKSTRGYGNHTYHARPPMTVLDGSLYVVSFTGGKDKEYHERWVYKRGDKLGVYSGLIELLLDRDTGLSSPPPSRWSSETVKLIAVIGLLIVLLFPVIYLAITNPESKGFNVLVGLVGLLLGYLVGKSDKNT